MKPTEFVFILARRLAEWSVEAPARLLAPVAVRGLTRVEAVRAGLRRHPDICRGR
jgi:hypothetical protein